MISMNAERSKLLVKVLKKIPIFKDLSFSQRRKVLNLCAHKAYQPKERLCEINKPSDEMYILLAGELAIETIEGIPVAKVTPVTTVGEMGVITGQKRSATVEVTGPSQILVIQKSHFERILRDDLNMRATIYRNIVAVLSAKLVDDNVRIRDYQVKIRRREGRIRVLERQLEALVLNSGGC